MNKPKRSSAQPNEYCTTVELVLYYNQTKHYPSHWTKGITMQCDRGAKYYCSGNHITMYKCIKLIP